MGGGGWDGVTAYGGSALPPHGAGAGPVVQREERAAGPDEEARRAEHMALVRTNMDVVTQAQARFGGNLGAAAFTDLTAALGLIGGSIRLEEWNHSGADAGSRVGGRFVGDRRGAGGAVRMFNSGGNGQSDIVHEAVHALHHVRYPTLRAMGIGHDAHLEVREGDQRAILRAKAVAWTEYWAYRRAHEFEQMQIHLQAPHQAWSPFNASEVRAIALGLGGLGLVGVTFSPERFAAWTDVEADHAPTGPADHSRAASRR